MRPTIWWCGWRIGAYLEIASLRFVMWINLSFAINIPTQYPQYPVQNFSTPFFFYAYRVWKVTRERALRICFFVTEIILAGRLEGKLIYREKRTLKQSASEVVEGQFLRGGLGVTQRSLPCWSVLSVSCLLFYWLGFFKQQRWVLGAFVTLVVSRYM